MPRWLNRNVWGMTITSLLSDACYEMVLAVLPGFLPIIHVAAAALGWIEGASDAFSSFLKLFAGHYSDKIGRRKGMIVLGYLFTGTGLSIFAAAVTWIPILLGRMVSWFGKGIRGSLRDTMLSESVDPEVRGRAFGFHRAGDTVGAIIGPLAGVALLQFLPAAPPDFPFRRIFLLSLIPGLCAPVIFALMVKETRRQPMPGKKLIASIRGLPAAFRRFLLAVGLFGSGDFSPTLLTLAAATLLRPAYGPIRAAQLAALLYVIRNVVYASASFPIGALADRMRKTPLLSGGYFVRGIGRRRNGAVVHKRIGEFRHPLRSLYPRRHFRRGTGHARRGDPARPDRPANARHRLWNARRNEWRRRSHRQRNARNALDRSLAGRSIRNRIDTDGGRCHRPADAPALLVRSPLH